MLHLFFKWRYERRARSGAFELPKDRRGSKPERANLGSYLSQTSGPSRSFRPYDAPRRRRRIMQAIATVLIVTIVAWITYESIIALALLGN